LCKTAVSRERRGLISEDSSDRKLDNVESIGVVSGGLGRA